MRNYKIDFRNQVRQLLPEHKRQPVRLRILRAFVKPLADLFAAFSLWRDETRKLLNVTNQEGVLEQFLRNKYGAADITIESYRGTEQGRRYSGGSIAPGREPRAVRGCGLHRPCSGRCRCRTDTG